MKHPDLEPEPDGAALLFGDSLDSAREFVGHLAEFGEELGLIGPLERSRLWSRHVLNSAVVARYLHEGGRVADVGSGAGLPGLVLAIARPDVELILIEPMERRTDWLLAETGRLGLRNVTVLRARAEEAVDSGPYTQVTARAVKALKQLIPMTRPLLDVGGEMLFLKGARVEEEVSAATKQIRAARLGSVETIELGAGLVPVVTRLFRATVEPAS